MWYMIRLILEAVFSDEDSNWGPRIRNSKVKFETKTGLTWTRMFVMYFRRYYAMRGAHINFEQNSPKVLLSSSICLLPYQPERWSLSTGYQLELRGDSLKILSLMYKHPHVWRTTLNLHCTPARYVGGLLHSADSACPALSHHTGKMYSNARAWLANWATCL